jgi:ferritin-like metal-binding protein YciE
LSQSSFKKCDAMAGLLEEAEGIIEETKVEMFVMPQ